MVRFIIVALWSPNICANMITGGNHERTTKIVFGNQIVNRNKGAYGCQHITERHRHQAAVELAE